MFCDLLNRKTSLATNKNTASGQRSSSLKTKTLNTMCAKCDALNALKRACEKIAESGSEDIALKFEAFGQMVKDHKLYSSEESDNCEIVIRLLTLGVSLAEGYLPLSDSEFRAKIESFQIPSSDSEIRIGMKRALFELFSIYRNRLPWALYGGYMFMVSRPNLHVAERLPELKSLLPADLPWECVDAVWHGFPPATALYLHILSVINKHTKTIPLHGCGCNHYLPPIKPSTDSVMVVQYPRPVSIEEETEVPISHCLIALETLVVSRFSHFGETTKSINHAILHSPKIQSEVPEIVEA